MAENWKVVIDAGHGGSDPGATYYGRQEKDDTLRLALAVGRILAQSGVDVAYTRINDVYDTPYEKAEMANNSNADFFVSIHRNAMPAPNTASGVQTLVYKNEGLPAMMAENINAALQEVGFTNLGIEERPGLVVLRRTRMPAVLVEAGFIDNEADNSFFDRNFQAIAEAIAHGILVTLEEAAKTPMYYMVQTGAYRVKSLAEQMLNQLKSQDFPAFLMYEDGVYKVKVGAFQNMDNAVRMERKLRDYGYNTFITRTPAQY